MRCSSLCRPCLVDLVGRVARSATNDPSLTAQAERVGLGIIDEEFGPTSIPCRLATRFQRAMREVHRNPDPFLAHKRREFDMARTLAPRLAPAPDAGFSELAGFAVLGNAMDFFRAHEDVETDLQQARRFGVDHRPEAEALLRALPRGALVLVLADNAGEVFFDRPLLAHLVGRRLDTVYVVKGKPSQNDATLEEGAAAGGVACAGATTGSDAVGSDLADCGDELRELWSRASFVLAKGMANFETLTEAADGPPVLHLMQAKCARIAEEAKVALGERVALLRQPGR